MCGDSMPKLADSSAFPGKICRSRDEGENLPWKARKQITDRFCALDNEGAFPGSNTFVLKECSQTRALRTRQNGKAGIT